MPRTRVQVPLRLVDACSECPRLSVARPAGSRTETGGFRACGPFRRNMYRLLPGRRASDVRAGKADRGRPLAEDSMGRGSGRLPTFGLHAIAAWLPQLYGTASYL